MVLKNASQKVLSVLIALVLAVSAFIAVDAPPTIEAVSKRTKAIRAYKKYLKNNEDNYYEFGLVYLDNNDIPELLTKEGSVVSICTYYRGKVKETYYAVNLNKGDSKFTYYKKSGIYKVLGYHYETWYESYNKLSKGKVKTKVFATGTFDSTSAKYYKGEINGKKTQISKSKFKFLVKKYKKGKKASYAKYYSNTESGRKKHCK